MRRNNRIQSQTNASADLVVQGKRTGTAGRHHLRRGGEKRKNDVHGAFLFSVEHGKLSKREFCSLRKNAGVGEEKCGRADSGNFRRYWNEGDAEIDRELSGCAKRRKKKPLLSFFGQRPQQSRPDSGYDALSGVLFDEAALQDRGFVEQAAARCSVQGSKFWFNCNPEYPSHWFYTEWIQKREEKNLAYLHFVMEDNPSLSPQVKRRYESLYSGSFYRRFIKGEWVNPQGSVYPMFSQKNVVQTPPQCSRFYLSCDYGTVNPCSMGLWGESGGNWYRLDEFYYDSKKEGSCKTDEEYYADLKELCGSRTIEAVIVDPSAASFIECIRRHGEYWVKPADNRVMQGIQLVSRLLGQGKLLFCACCADSLREFGEYRWEEGAGKEQPKKENDHAMDEIRYFAMEVFGKQKSGFFAISQPRA